MRLLLIDHECMGLDFVLRCSEAGHEIRWYKHSPNRPCRSGEGFPGFRVTEDWRRELDWVKNEGLILTTGNYRFLHELDRLREMGHRVFAPTVASARLEVDRACGMEVMRSVGIDVPEYHEFTDLAEALRFAKRSDQCWVFKPMGDEADKSLTFVPDSPEELVDWLSNRIEQGRKLKGKCILQEKIDALCEIGVSGWVGPEGFLGDKWQACVEHKKLMAGEIGCNTGEQGTVTQYVVDSLLAGEMLLPMEPVLRALGHRGDFAVGAIIDKSGKAWPLEFTSRLGWPAFFLQCASHYGDPLKWMMDLLNSKDSLKVNYDPAIGVVLAQPHYPYENSPPELVEGNPIFGMGESERNVHPVSVMKHRGKYQTSGEYVAVATALGKTLSKAQEKVYSIIKHIRFPDKMYRNDIGDKVKDVLPELHRHGYLMDMKA